MFFGKLKENRRLAVRYEKTDLAFLVSSLSLPSRSIFVNSA
jgi:hypothetical protein